MDHDDKFVGTILSRRDAIKATTLSGLALLVGAGVAEGAPIQKTVHLVVTPEVEEGPFFVDEGLNRSDITTGTDRKSVTEGMPLLLQFAVYSLVNGAAKPLKGAHVDVWHADAAGTYSDEESGNIQDESTKGQNYLRGYQIADENGQVTFKTIYPGWYRARTIHIHVKIRTFDTQSNKTHEFNTQMFFEEAMNDAMLGRKPYNARGDRAIRNKNDGLYAYKQADGTMVGSHLHFTVHQAKSGNAMRAEFSLALKLDA